MLNYRFSLLISGLNLFCREFRRELLFRDMNSNENPLNGHLRSSRTRMELVKMIHSKLFRIDVKYPSMNFTFMQEYNIFKE